MSLAEARGNPSHLAKKQARRAEERGKDAPRNRNVKTMGTGNGPRIVEAGYLKCRAEVGGIGLRLHAKILYGDTKANDEERS